MLRYSVLDVPGNKKVPTSCAGTMSPYPMVVMVVKAQCTDHTYFSNAGAEKSKSDSVALIGAILA